VGVDLAEGMLACARRRGVYDALHCDELLAVLGGREREFDLVAAADVLIYLGDLGPFFAAAARGLRPEGLLAFSTEVLERGDYRLLPTGRFAHAPEYVRGLAASAFAEEACRETTIRLEGARRLRGQLFLFRRRTEGAKAEG
jgi:predicted TPR repeat methyltransferase